MFSLDDFFNIYVPEAYAATYTPLGGVPVETVVFIDKDVEVLPEGFAADVVERRTEITLRADHCQSVCSGDVVVTENETFTLVLELDNDGFSVRAAAK